jgi:flagellar basal body-associated protein FliL
LNESADDTDYNPKRGVVNERTGHNTEISMERLDEEIKGGRSKKIIYISIGAFVALIVLTIILVFALKGSSNDNGGDDNPKIVVDYIYNPYTLN